MGHRTLYQEKGKNGNLNVKVIVRGEMERWRKGNNIITQHSVTLSQALGGCDIAVRTVKGTENLKLSQFDKDLKHILLDKGATDKEGKTGHHTALVLPLVPKDVDRQMQGLIQKLQ